ncbi:transketolase [Candidatus Woesearchaeota archaeon]|nr:transketolase [Candidatus Woesearchaeota archaeon]
MRKTVLEMVYELAKKDKRIFFIGSDLGKGTMDEFKNDFPDRFFMEGVSEQNLIGMAAGLAMEGKIVYVNTIATFLTRRCFEQTVVDLCLHNLPVRLIGNGGGVVYAPLGPTHDAIEDIAIMRAIPNMTVIAPADAEEMRRMMPLTVDYPGPIYIRLAKGGDPIVTEDVKFEIGKAIPVKEGKDALIITTGITLGLAQAASDMLEAESIRAAILHVPTIKPLDSRQIISSVKKAPVAVAVEEHSVIGGLGSAVAELIAEASLHKKFRRIGIPDAFPDQYGSQSSLMQRYGITAERIVEEIRKMRM